MSQTGTKNNSGDGIGSGCCKQNHSLDEKQDESQPIAHVPHFSKVQLALLAASPKQVVLASCTSGNKMEQMIEQMLLLVLCYWLPWQNRH